MIINTTAPKIWVLKMDSKTQNVDFLKNSSNDFDYITVTCGDNIPK
jgi:hypothetical protein